ncbi:hypothetical protein BDN72DRAFT_870819 [Pluteus cervinus]|uniref:Uncharacterized protein n=1 Tax=Pluteus cervinus TaxID=181527 RepID=A0ACD3AT46_9AGAR|nr:hypothetical protein BDN72DRAFT_870819 [Pluteus cervinus]
MGNRRISNDLKGAAVRLKNRGRDTDEETTKIVGFSVRTVYRTLRQKRLTGSVAKAQAIRRGRPRTLAQADADYLVALACHKPTLFLDEYRGRLERYRALSVSMTTIHRTFLRAKLSLKHRADFVRRIGQYPAECLISIDEMSKDDRTYSRLWGRSPRGSRAEVRLPFVRKRRFSLVAAILINN